MSTPNNEVPTGPDGQPLSKSALKKLAAKRKKEEQKAKRAAEVAARQAAEKKNEPEEDENYRYLGLNQSRTRENKVYTQIGDLEQAHDGKEVWIRGRLHNSRVQGGALCFVVLRERSFTVQCVIFAGAGSANPKAMVAFGKNVPKESIVDIRGVVKVAGEPIVTTTQSNVEVHVAAIHVVHTAQPTPVTVHELSVPTPLLEAQKAEIKKLDERIELLTKEDAEKNKEEIEKLKDEKSKAAKYNKVGQSVRLDNRVIDLRTQANQAIFQVQAAVGFLFREYLWSQGFTEIHSPKLIGGASEGGANVFTFKYFGDDACLAQSPQLYKQMAIASDFERVFEIAPVFRAENSFTHRHLCEFVGLDLEMAFKEHYHEVLDVLAALFEHISSGLSTRYARQLEIISQQYPFEPFVCKPVVVKFPDAVKMLNEAGWLEEDGKPMGDFDDLSTPGEKFLGKLIKEKYGTDFYILDKFPLAVRPFYTMPDPFDENYSNSYDLFMRGEEICSGAQRVHDAELLLQRATSHGIDPKTIQGYLDAFKYGCPPHAGGGVGLERVAMLYLGLGNIRKTSLFPRDPSRISP